MPNWCANSLQLTAASKEEADEFAIFLKSLQRNHDADSSQPTLFGYFVPEEWEEDEDRDTIMPNWYSWHIEHWGSKWDASMHDWAWVDDTTVVLTFDTAWSPPIETYEAMVEQGWLVSATYYESGMCFVGSWIDGEDEHYNFADCETPEAVRELIGNELDDEYDISGWMEQMIEEQAQMDAEESSNG